MVQPAVPVDPNWDPEPAERTYFRHQQSGERGWMVRRNGVEMVRRDLPNMEICKRLDHNWVIDRETRPLSHVQVCQVALAADRQLCVALGLHAEGKRQWIDMTDAQRIKLMHQGPGGHQARGRLWAAVLEALRGE